MKRVSLLAAVFLALPLGAQQPPAKVDADAMMDMYRDLARPVAERARLAGLAGRWTVAARLWIDPAGEPVSATGTGTGRMILGGRFVQLDVDLEGRYGVQSLTVIGFDRRFTEYTLVGYDTLGTYYVTAAGKCDAAAREVVLVGSYAMPPANEQQKYRFVWTSASKSERLLRLDFRAGGTVGAGRGDPVHPG